MVRRNIVEDKPLQMGRVLRKNTTYEIIWEIRRFGKQSNGSEFQIARACSLNTWIWRSISGTYFLATVVFSVMLILSRWGFRASNSLSMKIVTIYMCCLLCKLSLLLSPFSSVFAFLYAMFLAVLNFTFFPRVMMNRMRLTKNISPWRPYRGSAQGSPGVWLFSRILLVKFSCRLSYRGGSQR